MPASSGPLPTPPSPGDPSELLSAQDSLLRLSRRHSLPASTSLSGLLGFPGQQQERNEGRDAVVALSGVRHPRVTEHTRSTSAIVGVNSTGSEGAGNRHRYGHRHTRSEAYDQPIIVKNYNPVSTAPVPEPIEEEDEMDVQLPSLDDFSFDGILKAVDPQVNAALDGVTDLCVKYRETLQTEVADLSNTQTALQARMLNTDKLAAQVLQCTKARDEKLDGETVDLKGGAAVDSLAEATESTHTLMTSIVLTLLAIDEMLPPQDRLSPEKSVHRKHYPHLHTLLVGKAAELNICFGNGRTHGKRPSTSGFTSSSPAGGSGWTGIGESSNSTPNPQDLPLRRRMSSSSQILLYTAGLDRSSGTRAAPPHLQLKTILPSSDLSSPKVVDSAEGSYFPIAPHTATGISLAHSNGKTSSNSGAAPSKRSSGIWGTRPNTSTLAFLPIEEGEGMSNSSRLISPPAPTTPGGTFSWRRSSGSWSGFGGLFGGRSSKGSGEQAKRDRAEDRLKKVLESAAEAGKGKGKGKRVATSSW